MQINHHQFRGRAVMALHALVGGKASPRAFGRVPAALEVPHARLVVAAGDHEACPDPAGLRPIAKETGYDVVATWVDPFLSGHRFIMDVVLGSAHAEVHAERQLWLANDGGAFLLSGKGDEHVLAVTPGGLRLVSEPLFVGDAARFAGTARGQAHLQAAIFGGSPLATPIERGLAR